MCLTIVRRFIPNEPRSHKKVIRNDVRSTVAIMMMTIMIASPNHKTIDDPPSTRDLTSSIFLHVTIVYRLTHPCRDILNQLQSHNKVCCNNLDRL